MGNALLYGYDQLLVCRAAELPRKGPHGFGRDIVFRCDIERRDSAQTRSGCLDRKTRCFGRLLKRHRHDIVKRQGVHDRIRVVVSIGSTSAYLEMKVHFGGREHAHGLRHLHLLGRTHRGGTRRSPA